MESMTVEVRVSRIDISVALMMKPVIFDGGVCEGLFGGGEDADANIEREKRREERRGRRSSLDNWSIILLSYGQV